QGQPRDDRPREGGRRREGPEVERLRRLGHVAPRAPLVPGRIPEPAPRRHPLGLQLPDPRPRRTADHRRPRRPARLSGAARARGPRVAGPSNCEDGAVPEPLASPAAAAAAPIPSSASLDRVPYSRIRELGELALSMDGVLRLYFGESNLPTPRFIVEAAA